MIIFNLIRIDIAAQIRVDGLSRLMQDIQEQKAGEYKQVIFFH